MADINIYGRLWNQTTDGEIASAAQVKDSSFSKASEVDTTSSNPSQHDINEYLLDAIGSGGTASADALAQKVDKTTTINGHALNGDVTLSASDLGIDTTLFKVVDSLPTSDIDTTKIYIVASETTGTNNAYTEYVYVNSAWEKVGEYQASVDLSEYVKTQNYVTNSVNSRVQVLKVTNSDTDTDMMDLFSSPNNSYLQLSNGTYTAELTNSNFYYAADDNILVQIGLKDDENDNIEGYISLQNADEDIYTEIEKNKISIVDTENGNSLFLTQKEIYMSSSDTNESTSISPNSITLSDGTGGTGTLTTEKITKLDGIEEGAQANQNAFSSISIDNDESVRAHITTDTLNLYSGDGIKITCSDDGADADLTISCTATADEALTEAEIDAACS